MYWKALPTNIAARFNLFDRNNPLKIFDSIRTDKTIEIVINKIDTYSIGVTALKWIDYVSNLSLIDIPKHYTTIFAKAAEFDPRQRCTIGELITELEQYYSNTNQQSTEPMVFGGKRHGSRKTAVNRPSDPCSKAKANAKSKGPRPTDERVVFAGRNHVVYMGPRGGRYVKSKGKLVRL
jgi:hypothetical protein